jgi:hypothetical protein
MIILLFILLLFGLFQSLLELRKEEKDKYKWDVKRILSLFYIFGFVTGFIIIVLQNKESNRVNDLIIGISSSLKTINSISVAQLKDLDQSIQQTKSLIKKSDSLDTRMNKVIEFKEDLLAQYKNVNEKLSKQLELENKQLKERAPNIGLMDSDNTLEGTDSTSYSFGTCIRNFGKRTALIYSGNGYVVCFDINNRPIDFLEIRGNKNNSLLEPNEISQMRQCFYSTGRRDLKGLKEHTFYGVICLKIHH